MGKQQLCRTDRARPWNDHGRGNVTRGSGFFAGTEPVNHRRPLADDGAHHASRVARSPAGQPRSLCHPPPLQSSWPRGRVGSYRPRAVTGPSSAYVLSGAPCGQRQHLGTSARSTQEPALYETNKTPISLGALTCSILHGKHSAKCKTSRATPCDPGAFSRRWRLLDQPF
jgi:hypothetical protein